MQIEAIQKNKPLVIVGTPGRLAELSRSGALLSHTCPILVLDEVPFFRAPLPALALCDVSHDHMLHSHATLRSCVQGNVLSAVMRDFTSDLVVQESRGNRGGWL